MGTLLRARWAFTDWVYSKLPRARMLEEQLGRANKKIADLRHRSFSGEASGAYQQNNAANRLTALFDGIDVQNNRGIEMGPLDRPLMRKGEHQITYIDHASADDLRKKYLHTGTPDTLNPDAIEHVDIVWDGSRPLKEATDERNFDFCISSHVIEHVPDIIGWLQQIGTLLRQGSLVNMAIPHRNFTFDRRRQMTRPADLIQAYLQKRTRPDASQVFDHVSNASQPGSNDALIRPALISEAYKHAWAVTKTDNYMDVHCSVFTPESFCECFEVLSHTGLINLKLRKIWSGTSQGNEFVVSMEYGGFPLDEMATSFRDADLSVDVDDTRTADTLARRDTDS